MPFDEITERVAAVEKKPVSIRLSIRKRAERPSCIIGLRGPIMEKLRWDIDCDVVILFGSGTDVGKMRLKKVARGKGVAAVRPLRKTAASLDLGYISRIECTRPTNVIGCDARVVDGMVEIDLPDFEKAADEFDGNDEPEDEAEAPPPKPANGPTVPRLTEGYAVKGGQNPERSQIKERPAPPAPIRVSAAPQQPARKPIEKFGVKVTFQPPAIHYENANLDLTDRQARFLASLVSGFSGIMPTNKIIQDAELPASGGASMIAAEFISLEDPLKDELGLIIRAVPKMGYSLNKR